MLKITYKCLIILVSTIIIVSGDIQAQNQQQAAVQSSSGGTTQSASFNIVATMGQFSPIGQAAGGSYVLLSGFTYALSDTLSDISAPLAPLNISATPANWTRINNFNVSWTNPEGDANIAGTWYKLDEAPVNNTDGIYIPAAKTEITGIMVDESGSHIIYLWLQDINGNLSYVNRAQTTLNFDDSPPSVSHTPVTSHAVNAAIQINASASDAHSGPSQMRLLYRPTGATAILDSVDFSGDQAQIPVAANTQRGCEYAIAAIDNAGNRFRTPVSGYYSIQAILSGDGGVQTNESGQPVARHQGSQVTDYRIFSVPFVLDNNTPANVFEDDLGSYDDTKWKLFDVNNGNLRDYPTIRDLSIVNPGKGFLLIVNRSNIVIDAGSGRSASTTTHRQITVTSGWNLIGNPFDFDISTDSLKINGTVPELWYFDNTGWRNNPTQLKKWEGLALYANNAGTLTIGAASGTGFKTSIADNFKGQNWGMQVIAEGENSSDIDNYIGIVPAEQNNIRTIWHEPPRLADAVSLSIQTDPRLIQKERDNPVRTVSSYLQPYNEHGHLWDFELRAATAGEQITLTFKQFGKIPEEYRIYMIDPDLKMAYDLENKGFKHELSMDARTTRQFRLLIGNESFAAENSMGTPLIPHAYELRQNFPNPFNPSTSVIFTLPQTETVRLEIYDILGKSVKILIENQLLNAGYHRTEWDGTNNNGKAVASGVYFLRLSAGNTVKMRKAVLTR